MHNLLLTVVSVGVRFMSWIGLQTTQSFSHTVLCCAVPCILHCCVYDDKHIELSITHEELIKFSERTWSWGPWPSTFLMFMMFQLSWIFERWKKNRFHRVTASGPKLLLCTNHHLRRNTTGCILHLMKLQIASIDYCVFIAGVEFRCESTSRLARDSHKIHVRQVHFGLVLEMLSVNLIGSSV